MVRRNLWGNKSVSICRQGLAQSQGICGHAVLQPFSHLLGSLAAEQKPVASAVLLHMFENQIAFSILEGGFTRQRFNQRLQLGGRFKDLLA
jgi:hypothetical protein